MIFDLFYHQIRQAVASVCLSQRLAEWPSETDDTWLTGCSILISLVVWATATAWHWKPFYSVKLAPLLDDQPLPGSSRRDVSSSRALGSTNTPSSYETRPLFIVLNT
jgi:hypothetical protein